MPHSLIRPRRAADQERVDPQAQLAVEVALAVVPPGEADLAGMQLAVGVDARRRRAARAKRARSSGVTCVDAVERARVVHVDVGRADVEVAGEHVERADPLARRVEERELLRRTPGGRSRGRSARRPRRAAGRPPTPRSSAPRRRRARLPVPRRRPRAACARAPPRRPSARPSGARRDSPRPATPTPGRRRLRLRLLQQRDVGRVQVEQLEHARHADLERVDVPADELH